MWVTWDELMEMVRQRRYHNYGRQYFAWLHRHIYGEDGEPRAD